MKVTSNNKTDSESKTFKLKRINWKKKKIIHRKKNKKDSATTCSTVANNDNTTNRKNLLSKRSATEKCGSTSIITPVRQRSICLPPDKQDYSPNWKELSSNLSKTSLDKNSSKSLASENNSPSTKKVKNNKKSKIWFDDVDKTLIEMKSDSVKSSATPSKNFMNKSMSCTINFIPNLRRIFSKKVSEYVAIDCEMVGTGPDGKDNMLARVSLVDQNDICVYDKFVKPRESVTDYRTAVSGITPEKLENGTEFQIVQKEVSDLIKDKILVGHAVSNDLKVLFLDHPWRKLRDTSRYKPFRKLFEGRTPSLKNLTQKFLGVEIQHGQHNSVIDAQATMKIFKLHMQEWELNYGKSRNKSWKK